MKENAKPTAITVTLPAESKFSAALIRLVGERSDHRRHGQPKGKLCRRPAVGSKQHRTDNGCSRARYPGDHGDALDDSNAEIHQQRKAGRFVVTRLQIQTVDPQQDETADDERHAHDAYIE